MNQISPTDIIVGTTFTTILSDIITGITSISYNSISEQSITVNANIVNFDTNSITIDSNLPLGITECFVIGQKIDCNTDKMNINSIGTTINSLQETINSMGTTINTILARI